jgi:serine/threonine protein kinase
MLTSLVRDVCRRHSDRIPELMFMSEQIHPPVSLGRQQLLFSVGHGGMSDVYLALVNSAIGVNKLLVVKQLRASLLDEPEALSMFMDEARLAARLHHPNVVATFEVGQEGPLPYMTMEFLDGQPLHRILRRCTELAEQADQATPALTLGMRLRIMIEMLQGLDYAHELLDYDGTPLNVVHRDVSPQNLFITYDGQIKLVDFGIAKANASINHTQGRGLKGKLAYMSPQQAGGEIVDRRADVFAAGVMLWELLSGRRLWMDVNETQIVRRLIERDLPTLDVEGVPTRLLDICRTALAPALADRYATADAFRVALEQYVSDERLDTRTRAIGMLVAEAFARERAEVRSRIDQELLRQVTGGSADSPNTLWRDRYRSENTDRTLDSSDDESSLLPDEITADYGPRVTDDLAAQHTKALPPPREASGTIGAPASVAPSSGRRPLWPIVGAFAVGAVLVIPVLQTDDEPAGLAANTPASSVDVTPSHASPTPSGCDAPLHSKPRVTLTGDIEQDATLHCDRSYVLMFTTRVTGGATLTIEPGTTILGDRQTKGTLVVEPGARLIAEGTRERPIVFTSARPEAERRPGDWGGVLLLGRAPINLRDAEGKPMLGQVEGLAEVSRYGGNDPEDDSGVLRYVRIEYPGVEVAPANESNGLTLAGVGRATVIDHVAVHASSDDCFEFFGGTVDAKYLVCDAPGDDGLDFDLGYRGRLQFVVVRDLALADAHSDTPSNAFELDNDPNGTTAEPRTRPTIWNATLCGVPGGTSPSYAILARRAAEAEIHGVLASGFDFALDVRDSPGDDGLELSGLGLVEQPTAEPDEQGERDDDNGFDERAWLADPSRALVGDFAGFPGCAGPIPGSLFPASAIASPHSTPPVDDGFFDPTAVWVGAFAGPADDWTAGWVSWRE